MHSMDASSKKALASAYNLIVKRRESSYVKYDQSTGRGGYYTMGVHDAAEQLVREGRIDRATADLAAPMAGSGYADFDDWAAAQ